MPRKTRTLDEPRRTGSDNLAEQLADELRNNRPSGQPVIDEQQFPSNAIRVTVIWDAWDRLSLEDRTSIILRGYELVFGREYRDRIALASGLTVPEAHAAGFLPFEVLTALRAGDNVSLDECRRAMIEEGASTLMEPDHPRLRFATQAEAEAARQRLVARLPASEPVWLITQDVGKVEDWYAR